jgi:hypothetical protein
MGTRSSCFCWRRIPSRSCSVLPVGPSQPSPRLAFQLGRVYAVSSQVHSGAGSGGCADTGYWKKHGVRTETGAPRSRHGAVDARPSHYSFASIPPDFAPDSRGRSIGHPTVFLNFHAPNTGSSDQDFDWRDAIARALRPPILKLRTKLGAWRANPLEHPCGLANTHKPECGNPTLPLNS